MGGRNVLTRPRILGSLTAFVSCLLYTTSKATAQGLEGSLGDWELNATRFAVTVILSSLVLGVQRQWPTVERKLTHLVVLMCVLSCIDNFCLYAAAPLLPLGIVSSFPFALMMILAALFECVYERAFRRSTIVSIVICLSGFLCIIQPAFLGFHGIEPLTKPTHSSICIVRSEGHFYTILSEKYTFIFNVTQQESWHMGLSAEAGGYIYLSSYAITHFVANALLKYNPDLSKMNSNKIGFWGSSFSTLVSVVVMFAVEHPVVPSGGGCWALFSAHTWSMSVSALLAFYAAQRLLPFVFSLMFSLDVVFLGILQYTLLRNIQPGHRNWMEVFGFALILLANVVRFIFEWLQFRRNSLNEGECENSPDTSDYTELK